MSFLRIAVPGQPLRFVVQGPSSALVRHGGHAVPAENVGHMQVILTAGGNFIGPVDKRRAMTVVGRRK